MNLFIISIYFVHFLQTILLQRVSAIPRFQKFKRPIISEFLREAPEDFYPKNALHNNSVPVNNEDDNQQPIVMKLKFKNQSDDDSNDIEKPNIVLFFAHTSLSMPLIKHCKTLKYLQLEEKTRIKHEINIPKCRAISNKRNEKTCQDLLKLSLFNLINYCRSVLKMTTAVASASNESLYNALKQKTEFLTITQKENDNDVLEQPKDTQIGHNEQNNKESELPNPIFESAPATKGRKVAFKNIITAPYHEENFNLRNKREQQATENVMNRDILPLPETNSNGNKPFWGVLDIITDTRFSFFGKLFEDKAKKINEKEEKSGACLKNIGQIRDRSLFQIVKSTLTSIQNKDNPFLMIVIGGKMNDLQDEHSSLLQSVKYVVENDYDNNTLIVVSGLCFKNDESDSGEKVEKVEGKKSQNLNIPVYARGLGSDFFSECTELYDIPLVVKTVLSRFYKEGPDFEGYRNKRDTCKNSKNREVFLGWKTIKPILILILVLILLCFILLIVVHYN